MSKKKDSTTTDAHVGDLPAGIGNPARRALAAAGVTRLEQLTNISEKELLQLHGLGPTTIKILTGAMAQRGLRFATASPSSSISERANKNIEKRAPKPRANPFKMREFRGVNPAHIERMEARGIKRAEQMLAAGRTQAQRAALAQETGIPEEAIPELVNLADLARLPGVKGIRARLYYDAGVDSVEKMAGWEAEPLRLMVTAFAERVGYDGISPLPKEVSSTIANARKLPKLVEDAERSD